jgi:PAS domain S-box-containing protein
MASTRSKNRRWIYLASTLVAGGVFLALDLPREGAAITPLLALCWLLGVSTRVSVAELRKVVAVLLVFVIASLWGQDWDRLVIRALSFTVGGTIALMHVRARERARRLTDQLRQIVEQAPAGLITADQMGCILSASKDIKDLLGSEFAPLNGHSFSDVMMGQIPPGQAMRRYMEWFQREGLHQETFSLRKHPETLFHGWVICTGKGSERLLIASLGHRDAADLAGGAV